MGGRKKQGLRRQSRLKTVSARLAGSPPAEVLPSVDSCILLEFSHLLGAVVLSVALTHTVRISDAAT